ncbi:MAG: prolyl oligopeptidase family serine peptidase [Flammeovirgaceae bacterium]
MINKYIKIFIGIVAIVYMNTCFAQDKKDRWTPEDIIHTEFLRSATFSKDNNHLIWSKRRGVKKKDRFVSDLYLTRLNLQKDGQLRTFRFTNADASEYSAFFSMDGEWLYFLSSRDKGNKLWKMSLFGGEPIKVHEFKNGISSPRLLNEHTIIFTSNEGETLYEQKLKKKKDNVVVVEDSVHWKITRLYTFNLKDKSINRVTNNNYPVSGYAFSKDGKWLVTNHTMSRHYGADAHPAPTQYLRNLQTGESKQILVGLQTPYGFEFSADNNGFYFAATTSSDPEWSGAGIQELYYYDIESAEVTKVDLQSDWGLSGSFYTNGNDVIASLANGPTNKLAFYSKKGLKWKKSMIDFGEKNEHVRILSLSEDGKKVAYAHSTAGQLPKYYVADLTISGNKLLVENEKEIIKLNKKLDSKAITKHEVFRWKGYNDEEVNGILYYPENYEAGKKYPLVLSIHGGPASSDRDAWAERWSTYPQILAQRGAFVLKPNYHGSANHGRAFVESIKGHYYDLELEDITKGIEVLAQKGMVDKDKLGVMGWSNGAILTTMLTVRYPDMFKVACAGAGDVNWTSDFGTCGFGVQFDQSYFIGAPWDDKDGKTYNEAYITKSPLFELEKVKTPTLIFHGSEDRAVPRDQGWEYYRALQQNKKAPVRFLWFPGQPHGLQKITHQLRKMNEEIAWIDTYLFKTHQPKNEAFKETSPLAMLLKKEKAAQINGLYGTQQNGILIPEVSATQDGEIAIGRFEVTNAQFSAFNTKHNYAQHEANFPAQVSFEQAQSYVKWLSEKTGATYRLPSEKEGMEWHKKAQKLAKSENTLNYWAGYAITIDEVEEFSSKLSDLKSKLTCLIETLKT